MWLVRNYEIKSVCKRYAGISEEHVCSRFTVAFQLDDDILTVLSVWYLKVTMWIIRISRSIWISKRHIPVKMQAISGGPVDILTVQAVLRSVVHGGMTIYKIGQTFVPRILIKPKISFEIRRAYVMSFCLAVMGLK